MIERPKTLNAIPPAHPNDAEDRTTRHLRMCAELAELGMQLARAAAARTLTGRADPEAPPEVPRQPLATADMPSARAADTHSDTETATRGSPAATPPRSTAHASASRTQTDPAVLFTRLAAVVRDCIALEARLSAGTGATGATPGAIARPRRADPRRALLDEAFRRSIENHPDRADLRRETTVRLDEELAADPAQTVHPGRLFADMCDEFGIAIDFARLPDELLFAYPETTYPGGDDPPAADPPAADPRADDPHADDPRAAEARARHPRATSPP